MRVGLGTEAQADAEQAADWYIDHDAWEAARAFHEELAKALARIGTEPGLGTPASGGVGILPLHRFPYSLVYRVQGDLVCVIAVAAQRRRPGFWRGRL
jgi:plasmid stabilization system protein ParE